MMHYIRENRDIDITGCNYIYKYYYKNHAITFAIIIGVYSHYCYVVCDDRKVMYKIECKIPIGLLTDIDTCLQYLGDKVIFAKNSHIQ